MKNIKLMTSVILGSLVGMWFTIAEHSAWWMAVISIFAAIGFFIWVSNHVEKTVLWVLAMIACFFAVRLVGLPVVDFIATIWIGIIAGAFAVAGWAFKTIGVIGGVIIVILIIIFIKGLVS